MEQPSAERWPEIEALLDAALDLPPDARSDFLDRAAPDPVVGAAAARLLQARKRVEHFLERPATWLAASLLASTGGTDAGAPLPTPQQVGPYRVVRELGHGGMGAIFLAERADPQLRQRVALKLVRGVTTEPLVRRFLEERQILASLDHPNIARLLDGGITADGLPWFAMEYIEGTAIDRYCDEHGLGIGARLALFLRVCDAVQYAHRNLVVHRDLKPSNILVTDAGWVKLLDFGIAKLLASGGDAAAARLTQSGPPPMTPLYASPEQIRGETVSTATDVYALGVLLYNLLTGQPAYQIANHSPHEIARVILQEEAKPPSAVAARASRGRLRGDLDTIVLTALRKEPERRYATAEQLAADVRRHVEGQPVRARPDTWGYRTGKFVRRHRAGVAAALVFAGLLVGYGVTVTMQANRVAREAAKTERVKEFLVSLFTHAMPAVTKGSDPTASELVERGARRVAVELADQPEIQAEMMMLLGRVYLTMGRYDAAIAQLEPALAIRRRLQPGLSRDAAATAQLLAEALHYQGRFADADTLLREVIEAQQRLFGAESAQVGATLNDLGDLLHTRGEYAAAEEHLRQRVGHPDRRHR
jgi:eukaryotic-like serine/threonine-protein kinase